MKDLDVILRRALESLAFQAPDMGEQAVHDQVASHLRHNDNPILGWEIYRAAYDAIYDLEVNQCDPSRYSDFPTDNYSKETLREILLIQWKQRLEIVLADLIEKEKVA